MNRTPEARAAELTQRLDHSVPDPKISAAANQKATADLASVSSKLNALLPDASLSPFEKLERLARVVEDREPDLTHLQPAVAKVAQLKERLDQLVPGNMSSEQKIDSLIEKLNAMVPPDVQHNLAMHKLELLGDPRGRVEPE
jgi:hypothetical protein